MLRGEFIRGDGLVIPNNITSYGAQTILAAALRNVAPSFWVGLVDGVPESELQIEDLIEPTIGEFDYARKEVERSIDGWPSAGILNGEPYLESLPLVWAASGGNWLGFRRLMLTDTEEGTEGDVIALSAPLPAALVITPTTELNLRTFKYRIYLR